MPNPPNAFDDFERGVEQDRQRELALQRQRDNIRKQNKKTNDRVKREKKRNGK